MKYLFFILLLVLVSLTGSSQSSSYINIVGVWTLTDYNNANKFEDIWEFTSDGIFNELKYQSDGDTTLVPDENGTWMLKDKTLRITVTGEDTRGEQKLFDKPQIMEFEITKEDEDYILTIKSDEGTSDGKTTKLRLTKK